jgi:CDP-glycerol glycerophosphotransferase (TagB/SpsB family)
VLRVPSPLAPDRQAIRTALGVPDGKRLVLWMPTFRTPQAFRIRPPGMVGFRTFLDDVPLQVWQELDEHAAGAACRIVLKLHPWDALEHSSFDPQQEWGLRHVHLMRAGDWARLHLHLYDVLAVTDGLISDLSSVLIDWLLTSRPLGVVGFDPATFVRDMVIDVPRLFASDRIHDLADPVARKDFFTGLAEGRDVPADPALNEWLCRADLGSGCETVLASVSR